MDLSLGIDFGTSGARAIALDAEGRLCAETRCLFSGLAANLPEQWQTALWSLIQQLPQPIRQQIKTIALNGTSSTVLLCDPEGLPITEPLLYNDDRGRAQVDPLRAIAPPEHVVLSATSSLAKLLWWESQDHGSTPRYLLHQADWLSFLLHGQLGISDYHNALKLGYDVEKFEYPDWFAALPLKTHLPKVVAPGTVIGPVKPAIAQRFNLPPDCEVCAGTTDSIAAFLASGAQQPGDAVTSLGSTLVLKLLSQTRVEAAAYGIYSHRLGNLWLVGGASNTGGAVLQQFFSAEELITLSQRIDPHQESPLDYYPLLQPGERFPINDPQLAPRLTPQPSDRATFLHGLLESMARIEAQGYQQLQTLGASRLQQVYTAGGGAQNSVWTYIRARRLQVPVHISAQTEAAYGTALLARQTFQF